MVWQYCYSVDNMLYKVDLAQKIITSSLISSCANVNKAFSHISFTWHMQNILIYNEHTLC